MTTAPVLAYTIDDVFEMAEQIEISGRQFYLQAAKPAAEGRPLFLELAAAEEAHRQTFARMRAYFPAAKTTAVTNDVAVRFLRGVARGLIFNIRLDTPAQLESRHSLPDILRLAIGKEEDSIVFYTGILDWIATEQDRKRIQAIIAEEMRHLVKLQARLP